jgi:MutS domain V
MTDKIFSRIGFQDNIEQNASSFTVELREMEYIYSNLTPNSLVIMDNIKILFTNLITNITHFGLSSLAGDNGRTLSQH